MADLPKNVANGKFFWTLRGLNIPETVCDLFYLFLADLLHQNSSQFRKKLFEVDEAFHPCAGMKFRNLGILP